MDNASTDKELQKYNSALIAESVPKVLFERTMLKKNMKSIVILLVGGVEKQTVL